jgi:hypothetical protein
MIQVKLNKDEFTSTGGRPKATWELKLKEWVWFTQHTDGKLTCLAAKHNGVVRYQFGNYIKEEVIT